MFRNADGEQPAIIGTNVNESESLVAWNPNGPNQTDVNESTLGTFLCPTGLTTTYVSPLYSFFPNTANTFPRNRYAVSAPTYRYYYAGNFSNILPRPWEGAYHWSELPLIFGTSGIGRGENTSFELAGSHRIQDLWLAFITDLEKGLEAQG